MGRSNVNLKNWTSREQGQVSQDRESINGLLMLHCPGCVHKLTTVSIGEDPNDPVC